MRVKRKLDADDGDEFLHGTSAALQFGLLFRSELDLDDLLNTVRTEFHGDADEEALDAVVAVEVDGAGHDLLIVLENGFDHFGDGRRGRVIRRPGLQILHDLGAAITRALNERRETFLLD